MAKLLFTLLMLGSGAGVGLAGILTVMHHKLSKVSTHKSRYQALTIILSGTAITQGVLTWRLAETGTADPTAPAWFYTAGLIIVTIGLGLLTKSTILELAIKETFRYDSDEAEKAEKRNGEK